MIGNDRLTALPPRELVFENAPDGAPLIATARAKHDLDYQKRHGIDQRAAEDLPDGVAAGLEHLAKRIYRTLELRGTRAWISGCGRTARCTSSKRIRIPRSR